MKKALIVAALTLVLTFAFATGAFATTGKFFTNSQSYYTWMTTTRDNTFLADNPGLAPTNAGATGRPTPLYNVGDNPTNPGAHANYLATTAKCGMCHSVHRAVAAGVKLLPTADATCAGCHTGSTAVTAKIVTWTPYDVNWVPVSSLPGGVTGTAFQDAWHNYFDFGKPAAAKPAWDAANASITNKAAAGGAANGGGPHNDSALDLIVDGIWDGTGPTPAPDYNGSRYGCFTRRCHATNPHGAGGSKYKIFAAKLLFNESANEDELGDGTYGGLDAVYDDLGATDAAVQRFIDENPTIISADVNGNLFINTVAPDVNQTHALVAGLTCGRPSNPTTGEDECHAEASYAIVDKGIKEQRNHATNFTSGSGYRTDNTGSEVVGWGGNDNRDWKTGHVAGTFAAVPGAASYAPIAGCTSCHDQTDGGNTVYGNFTFPHGQSATGATNLFLADGVTPATTGGDLAKNTAVRSRIWAGWGGSVGGTLRITASANKAYDGQCLKCHRDGTGSGIGLNF